MGANQSSKRLSPLGARRLSVGSQQNGKSPSQRAKGLSQSLRKSVSNVLAAANGATAAADTNASKLNGKSGAANGADEAPNGSLQNAGRSATATAIAGTITATDSYYVSGVGNLMSGKSFAASSTMNNYVTMQRQPGLTVELVANEQPGRTTSNNNNNNNNKNNNNNSCLGYSACGASIGSLGSNSNSSSSESGGFSSSRPANGADQFRLVHCSSTINTTTAAASASTSAREPMEMNSARNGGCSFNGAQDHHDNNNGSSSSHNHNNAFGPASVVVGRSQQRQQQQPMTQAGSSALSAQPFHLARVAVNTKTSSVLNNSSANASCVAMPNALNAATEAIATTTNVAAIKTTTMTTAAAAALGRHGGNSAGVSVSAAWGATGFGSSSAMPLKQAHLQLQQQQSNSATTNNKYTSNNDNKAAPYQYHGSNQQQLQSYGSSPTTITTPVQLTHSKFNTKANEGAHLLASLALDDSENQTNRLQQYYFRDLLDNDHRTQQQQQQQHHHQQQQQQKPMNALQRRYKLPQQQYQYLNTSASAAIDFHQATYGQQYRPSTQLFPGSQQLDCGGPAGAYSRSCSFGSSLAALNDNKQKHRSLLSPLASLFNTGQQNNTPTLGRRSKSQANTIHLARTNRHSNNNNNSAQAYNLSGGNSQRSEPGSLKRIKSAPLTAQHATYEAMRTIDMYLIRQIARSCMDFEMEQKIDLEIRLRELAAQSMLEARNEIDVLEVEKSLLTSDQRMNCYASRLEQQRKQLSNPSLSTDSGRGSSSKRSNSHGRQPRSDVIGATATGAAGSGAATCNESTSSPSFSASSSSQSPSKLSPVSGESANSPSFTSGSSATGGGRGTGHRSRTGHARNNSLTANNTLSAKQRALNKRRELLLQSIASQSNINCNMVINNRASVSISEIRIPLMWRDVDHFKQRGDYKRFAIFCLLKIDSQIYDTQLITDVDRQVTDVTFTDLVVFNEIEHNFELTLEVYSCVYLEQFSLSSTPRKLKEKLTSSVSRAMGRRLATQTASINYTKELQAYDKSYRFAMIASATLRLEDALDSVKTYDLVLVSPSAHHRHHSMSQENGNSHTNNNNTSSSSYLYPSVSTSYSATNTITTSSTGKDANKNTLPLFGHFCCKLTIRPDVFDKSIKTGYLRVATISLPAATTNTSGRTATAMASDNGESLGPSTESAAKLRAALAASSKMATMSMSCSSVHWGLLRNFTLHLWTVNEQRLEVAALQRGLEQLQCSEAPRTKPQISLRIDKFARLLRVSNSSLTIETDKGCFVLGAYYPTEATGIVINQADELGHWLRAIEQHIYDSHIWGSVLQHYPSHTRKPLMEPSPNANEGQQRRRKSTGGGKEYSDCYRGAVLQADL